MIGWNKQHVYSDWFSLLAWGLGNLPVEELQILSFNPLHHYLNVISYSVAFQRQEMKTAEKEMATKLKREKIENTSKWCFSNAVCVLVVKII